MARGPRRGPRGVPGRRTVRAGAAARLTTAESDESPGTRGPGALGAYGLDELGDFEVGAFGNEHRVRAQLVPIAQEKARRLRGFDPATMPTILVGDTTRDVDAGLGGGARVIAVATGVDSLETLNGSGADAVLPSLEDVDAFFDTFARVRALGPAPIRG